MLAVQGPEARGIVERSSPATELPARFTRRVEHRRRDSLVCGTGYTGEDGVELLVPPDERRRGVGRARRAPAPRPPAWPRATRCASRSASTSTATT